MNLVIAKTFAFKLGISRVITQVLPQEKDQIISSRLKKREKKIVTMVGDKITVHCIS
jgi:cation transport ATPase